MTITIDKGTRTYLNERLVFHIQLEFDHSERLTSFGDVLAATEAELLAYVERLDDLMGFGPKGQRDELGNTKLDKALEAVWPRDAFDDDYIACLLSYELTWIDADGYEFDVRIE